MLIVVHLITARISDAILDSRVGMIDRVLGFVFGVVRGFVLIVIPYMFYEAFVPDEKQHFPWVRDARFRALHQERRRHVPHHPGAVRALVADQSRQRRPQPPASSRAS